MYLCAYVACLFAYMYNRTKEIRRVDLQFLFQFMNDKYQKRSIDDVFYYFLMAQDYP